METYDFLTAVSTLRCEKCVGIRRKRWNTNAVWTKIGNIGEVFPNLNTADFEATDWEILFLKSDTSPVMMYDPAFGTEKPFPSHPDQYRAYHGNIAWIFNPWTGQQRHPLDVGSDVTGLLIAPQQV